MLWKICILTKKLYNKHLQDRTALGLRERGWLRSEGMSACSWPLHWTGDRDDTNPEQVNMTRILYLTIICFFFMMILISISI